MGGDVTIKSFTLIHIATDQINAAGPLFITDEAQRTRLAGWNLVAAKSAAFLSNFQAALNNYQCGILFISSRDLWRGDSQLCLELHEGAAYCLYALARHSEVKLYANAIIENLPFEESLVAQDLLLQSLENAGHYTECAARGIAVLRLFKIHIPSSASLESIAQTI